MSVRLEDVVIVIPGITGSVLEKDGKRVWDAHGGMLWRAASGSLLPGIQLPKSTVNHADDGVRATRLINVPWVVSGLIRSKGYGEVREALSHSFELIDYDPGDPSVPANFAEFPYDWRLDNRESARALRQFMEERVLARRRECPNARALLLAHSMGGLVGLYALEVYGGRRFCRSLITLGTPFLGAPKSLGELINGYRLMGLDASEALRTFPSVYQLLPTYPCVSVGTDCLRVMDLFDELGLDRTLVENAGTFHQELIAAFDANQSERDYHLQPIAGIFQPTFQSLGWQGRVGMPLNQLPPDLAQTVGDGDGTVPRISASFGNRGLGRTTFLTERHSYLQANRNLFTDLVARLQQVATGQLPSYLGSVAEPEQGIILDPPEAVNAGVPYQVAVAVAGAREATDLVVQVFAIAESTETLVQERTVAATSTLQSVGLDPLAAGLYSLRAAPRSPLSRLTAVHDLLLCDPLPV